MKDDRLYLIHIQECLQRIEDYTRQYDRDRFMDSPLVQDAVIRNLQVMAESTQRLSEQLKESHRVIDWYKIAGFRNILVHDYLGVDLDIVWQVIVKDLPGLKQAISLLLE